MRRIVVPGILAIGLATGAAADPVFGTWNTEPDEGYYVVKMQNCGSTICGVIENRIDAEGNSSDLNKGKKLVVELVNDGGKSYSGKVWHPGKDKIFKGKATLNGKQMDMSGCVFGGLICLSQTWTRAN